MRLTIVQKIVAGFCTSLAVTLCYVAAVYVGVDGVFHQAEEVIAGYRLTSDLARKEIDHLNWANKITALITNREVNSLDIEVDDHRCGFGRWLYGQGRQEAERRLPSLAPLFKAVEEPHHELHQTAIAIREALDAAGGRGEWQPVVERIYQERTVPALAEIQRRIGEIGRAAAAGVVSDGDMLAAVKRVKRAGLVFGLLALVLGGLSAYFVAGRLSRALHRITDGITDNAKEVQAAAGELTLISRELSDSAGAQASSIEEMSASLEEMSATSRQTSELTAGVEKLMNINIERSGQSLKSLVDLCANMEKIEKDSDKISQIISTIDGIAFQTNLLALNAAVEAARAGEAGAGFAVVADEVKNLARRSAEAAKTTQELLDRTLERIGEGSRALQSINADFDQIVSSATSIGDKSVAITQATVEQAQGISNVSQGAQEIDKVTSGLAAHAAHASEASVKLADQAEEMRIIANQLVKMVYGGKGGTGAGAVRTGSICWEEKNCPPERRDSCPAYPDAGHECWMVTGTLCGGQEQGSFHEKLANCKQCVVYQKNQDRAALAMAA